MMSPSILIAGIGNIFHGDDAFGVAVARRLTTVSLPENVRVVEFGIRGIDLAFALLDGYDVTILVDAMARGGPAGTLYMFRPDLDSLPQEASFVEAHGLDPVKVLSLAKSMGAEFKQILLVACEPLTLGDEETGHLGLSDAVQAAVEPAIEMILSLITEIQSAEEAGAYAHTTEGF